jgi:hypothetical protein
LSSIIIAVVVVIGYLKIVKKMMVEHIEDSKLQKRFTDRQHSQKNVGDNYSTDSNNK